MFMDKNGQRDRDRERGKHRGTTREKDPKEGVLDAAAHLAVKGGSFFIKTFGVA